MESALDPYALHTESWLLICSAVQVACLLKVGWLSFLRRKDIRDFAKRDMNWEIAQTGRPKCPGRRRLAMAFAVNNCMLVMWLIINTATQINILRDSTTRWMSPALAWLSNACLVFFGTFFFFPCLLRPCLLDIWFVFGMVVMTLISTPMVTTLPQAVHMSVLMLAIYRLPAVVVCTQPWLVTLCNMPPFLVMLLRIYGSSYPAGEDCDFQFNQLNATFLEVFNLVVVSMGSYVLEKTLRSQVKQSILISKAATELTAASSLLQLTCDAVVELDEESGNEAWGRALQDLRLTTPAHDLGAMLLRNRQTSSLLGKKFVDLVPTTTEAERAEEILRGKAASDEIAAQAFHTRLVDSCSSKFRTEVFHVQYRRLDGHLCHLIGLRDFTDQGSLAGRNAKDSTEEAEEPEEATVAKASSARPRIVADDTRSEHSVESQGPRKVFVQIDMEKLQVVACSVSASSLSAQALDDLFGPAEIDFLKQVWTQVQALDSRNQLDNKEMSELLCAIPPAPSPRHEDDEDDDYDRSCRCC
eukprot:s363_g4.t1